MSGDATGPCPAPMLLAAFMERGLDVRTREEIVRHAAVCAECVTVIAESSRYLENTLPFRRNQKRWWLAAAAVLTITVLPYFIWRTQRGGDPMEDVRRIAGSNSTRPVEGRLTGFPHRAYVSRRSASLEHSSDISLRAVEARLRNRTNAESLHALGALALLRGDESRAVTLLLATAGAARTDPSYWSDLSAAQTALGAATGRVEAFQAALSSADRALALEPDLAPAHFNRAIAAEHLGRTAQAEADYRRALVLDPSSPWSEEIRERIQRLHR